MVVVRRVAVVGRRVVVTAGREVVSEGRRVVVEVVFKGGPALVGHVGQDGPQTSASLTKVPKYREVT